ncbi:MAG: hypothetical protein IKL09_03085 [Clostridia bacterium]|nr:hypothetical protein [Clostridia bacterium]
MSRTKLKALLFLDYVKNVLLSLFGLLVFSWLFRFKAGHFIYSLIFCLTQFAFFYSRGSLAAKIDMRTKEANIKKALELAFPLTIALVSIIAVYLLFHFDILPAKDVLLKTAVAEDGTSASLYLMDVIAISFRFLFFNVTGFMKDSMLNPFIFLVSPIVTVAGTTAGYHLRTKGIYLADYFIKAKDFVLKKFNS